MTTCERYAELDSAERYVAGVLTTDQAAEFEQHFLACDACLATVRGIEDVRDALVARRAAIARGEADPLGGRAEGTTSWLTWAAVGLAAAAALILGVFWMRGAPSPAGSQSAPASTVARDAGTLPASSEPPSASSGAPSPASAPATSAAANAAAAGQSASGQAASGQAGPGQAAPANASAQPPAGSGPLALIARLAMVTPPPYVAVPVRGEGDNVQQTFAAAMTRYRAEDYAGAAEGLRAIVAKSPDLASAQFYLGISELMTRQTSRAETALRAASDSDVTPYADEAWFYLGKAALQRGDVAAAERAFTEAVAREAGPGNEAGRLLEEVRALGRS